MENLGFLFMLFINLLTIVAFAALPVVCLYLAFRFVRGRERQVVGESASTQLIDRVSDLEARLEELSGAIERLEEAQRFTTALLMDRSPLPSTPERQGRLQG